MRAFITGVSGQTGSYLADLLVEQGDEVYGLIRRTSTSNTWRIDHLKDKITLLSGDLTDYASLVEALKTCNPHQVYNFAAQSFVGGSFTYPIATCNATGMGAVNLLEAIRAVMPDVALYQASTSEMYGNARRGEFLPVSPYGCAKTFAHHMMTTYRSAYGLHICCGIAFNHESPRRGSEFVTQKLVQAAVRIEAGLQSTIALGNLTPVRDFLHAKDVARAAWMMLQQKAANDYVIASGVGVQIQQVAEYIFAQCGLTFADHVVIDRALKRANEIDHLTGGAEPLRTLGWTPTYTWQQIFDDMIAHARTQLNHPQSVHGGS